MWLHVCLIVIVLVYYWIKSFKYDHWDKKGIPTASGCEWFFGHLKPVMFSKIHMNYVYDAMYKEFPEAPLVGYYAMTKPGLLVKDLDIVKTILVLEFPSFNFNGFNLDKKVDPLAGCNPFVLRGEEWKTARTRITPPLSLAKLKGYVPIMLDVGDEMVKYLKKNMNGSPLELEARRDLAVKYTSDIIGNVIYGIKSNTFEDKNSLFTHLTQEINFKMTKKDQFMFFLQQLPFANKFFPARFASKRLEDLMVSLTRKIIAERTATGEKRNDVYQVYIDLRKNDTTGTYTDENISGHIFAIIADLHETASSTIALILYTISRHLDIQNKLRAEIKEMLSKNNGNITIEDVENAKYLDKVFCETFRVYSFMMSRECTQDCNLPMPGSEPFKVTKGTPIIIPVASIHKDPKFYPDPETFDPERFSEEEIAKRPKYTFMPFGEGPRKCLGIRIVSLEIKIAIIKLFQNFIVLPSPKTKYPIEFDSQAPISIQAKGGSWVIFEEIK